MSNDSLSSEGSEDGLTLESGLNLTAESSLGALIEAGEFTAVSYEAIPEANPEDLRKEKKKRNIIRRATHKVKKRARSLLSKLRNK